MSFTPAAMLAPSIALLAAAAVNDVAFRIIPNLLVALLAVFGFGLRIIDHQVTASLVVAFVIFGAAFLVWRRGWLGGGDVKLLAATALVVPPAQSPLLILAMALAGGILALIYLALSLIVSPPAVERPRLRLARILRLERRRVCRRASIPYGVAIAAGGLFCLFKVTP